MSRFEVVAQGLDFPEGPVVMADGSVIVVEIHGGRLTRCWNGRTETVAVTGGGPNGLAIGPDGAMYVCQSGGLPGEGATDAVPGRIERVDLATGRVEPVYEACDGTPFSAPNDIMFDCDGAMWFTDLGRISPEGKAFGGLYRATVDGNSVTRINKGNALSYNGVGISPDMSTVYVADMYPARVLAYDRKDEAQVPRLVATVPGLLMLDSLAMTAAGNVCVGAVTGSAIATVTPAGEVSMLPVPDRLPTNIAFGGPDMRDAWITFSETGQLVKCRWDEPGMRLVYNA